MNKTECLAKTSSHSVEDVFLLNSCNKMHWERKLTTELLTQRNQNGRSEEL